MLFSFRSHLHRCLLLTILVGSLLLSSCTPNPSPIQGISFTDDLGRSVTVDHPQNVAALLSSFAQVWLLSGGSLCAAPEDAWEELALPLEDTVVNLGSLHSLSLEILLSAKPDFILASANSSQDLQWMDTLEALQIPVAYFDVTDFEDYLNLLSICTQINGNPQAYDTYGLQVQQKIQTVIDHSITRLETQSAPRILCLTASASGIHTKNSQDNVLSRILQNLGCVNLADSNSMLLEQLSMEQILLEDPDMIFFVQRGSDPEGAKALVEELLTSHPGWACLTAVRTGQVYFMEKELYSLKPNHRWAEAYERVEEILSHD